MAALEKIRSYGKIVMIVVFVALLSFVVGDLLTNSSAFFTKDQDKVGEVDGTKLTQSDFQKEVDALTTLNKMQGSYSNDANIRNEVWQTFVLSNVIKEQAEEIGMAVTAEEMEYATKVNPHPYIQSIRMLQDGNGRYNKQVLENMLKAFKQMEESDDKENGRYEDLQKLYNSWICVEKKLSNRLLCDKYFNLWNAATSTPNAEKQFNKNYSSKEVSYLVAYQPFSMIADSAYSVTPEEAKAKYKELEKRFKTNAYRTIKAIVYDVKPLAEDSADAKERTQEVEKELANINNTEEAILLAVQECDPAIYNRNTFLKKDDVDFSIRDFAFSSSKDAILPTFEDGIYYKTAKVLESATNRPDSVKISCIYLTQKPKAELKKTIDSLQNELKNGAKFADLAEKHTMDTRSKEEKGSLGWFEEGQFARLKDFDNKVFTAKVGDVFEMEDRGEYFLLKVDSISATSSPKVKIAEVAVKIESSTATYRKYYESASKYLADNSDLDAFTNNANENGQFVQEYQVYEDDNNVGNMENGRKIVNWAFNKDRKAGDIVAQPFESANQCVIAALANIVEKGYAPYSEKEVKKIVDDAVINDKKAEKIINEWKGKEIAEMASVDTIKNVRYDSERMDATLLGVLTNTEAGAQSEPFKSRNGVYAVKVLSKEDVEPMESDNRANMIRYYFSQVYNQVFSTLIEKADVKDNRSRFY